MIYLTLLNCAFKRGWDDKVYVMCFCHTQTNTKKMKKKNAIRTGKKKLFKRDKAVKFTA